MLQQIFRVQVASATMTRVSQKALPLSAARPMSDQFFISASLWKHSHEQESNLAGMTVLTLSELLLAVVLGDLDLEGGVLADMRGETGEGLPPRPADPDQQHVTPGLPDHPHYLRHCKIKHKHMTRVSIAFPWEGLHCILHLFWHR